MQRDTSNFLIGILTGAVVGAATALLMAPMRGSETRQRLGDQLGATKEKAKSRLGEAKEKAKGRIEEARHKAEGRLEEAKHKAEGLREKAYERRHEVEEKVAESGMAGMVGKVDLNSASREELMQIEGIGPATADDIIAYREEHGGFKSVDELEHIVGHMATVSGKFREKVKV